MVLSELTDSRVQAVAEMVDVEYSTVEEGKGVELSMRLYKPPGEVNKVAMVLVHQYTVLGGCQGLMKGMASLFASRGYLTATFDQRGAGRSTGKSTFTGSAEVNDVVAVCRWVAEKNPTLSICLIGCSAGQSLSLMALLCWFAASYFGI
jgi:predicted acyl esterase